MVKVAFEMGRLYGYLVSLKYKYKHHKNEGREHLTQKTKVYDDGSG